MTVVQWLSNLHTLSLGPVPLFRDLLAWQTSSQFQMISYTPRQTNQLAAYALFSGSFGFNAQCNLPMQFAILLLADAYGVSYVRST